VILRNPIASHWVHRRPDPSRGQNGVGWGKGSVVRWCDTVVLALVVVVVDCMEERPLREMIYSRSNLI
jgi:hypothetical protein